MRAGGGGLVRRAGGVLRRGVLRRGGLGRGGLGRDGGRRAILGAYFPKRPGLAWTARIASGPPDRGRHRMPAARWPAPVAAGRRGSPPPPGGQPDGGRRRALG